MPPKSVLITGCSSGGIGHALAREFHSQGLRVFATARNSSSISDLAALGIETLSLEVTSATSITNLAAEIASRTNGALDILVNNAGRNYTVPALEIEPDELRETFETNVFGVMALCRAFAPQLIAARGTIVQIGSVAAIVPYVFGSAYNASKAALHAYSNTLRVELAPFDVRVVTVVTGGVTSNIARTKRALREDSVYLPVETEYERRLTHSQSEGVPNEDYARRVVSQVLGSRKVELWEGGKSWVVWFVSSFLPKWVLVRCVILDLICVVDLSMANLRVGIRDDEDVQVMEVEGYCRAEEESGLRCLMEKSHLSRFSIYHECEITAVTPPSRLQTLHHRCRSRNLPEYRLLAALQHPSSRPGLAVAAVESHALAHHASLRPHHPVGSKSDPPNRWSRHVQLAARPSSGRARSGHGLVSLSCRKGRLRAGYATSPVEKAAQSRSPTLLDFRGCTALLQIRQPSRARFLDGVWWREIPSLRSDQCLGR
nr:nadph-dependent 1-acyldihydroxyacetone phosphate reductase [Quercus suber]